MKFDLPTLLIVLDGLSDDPVPEFLGQTPLQVAHIPTFHRLATEGHCGLADPIEPGKIATTLLGTLAILGYDPMKYNIGRGLAEAFGAEMKLKQGDVALRGNWASVGQDNHVVDRRAGRVRDGIDELIESVSGIKKVQRCKFMVKAGSEHRFAIVMRGWRLSDQIVGSDPLDPNPNGLRIEPQAINPKDKRAVHTAKLLSQYEAKVQAILAGLALNQRRVQRGQIPVNCILTRGACVYQELPRLRLRRKSVKGVCIAGEKSVLGVARMARMDTHTSSAMTANLDTHIQEKFNTAKSLLKKYDLVMLHLKGCDIAAHDRRPLAKRDYLERVDWELDSFLKAWKGNLRVGIIADHTTSSALGIHTDSPVPALIYDPKMEPDFVHSFDEYSVRQGALGRFRLVDFLEKLLLRER